MDLENDDPRLAVIRRDGQACLTWLGMVWSGSPIDFGGLLFFSFGRVVFGRSWP